MGQDVPAPPSICINNKIEITDQFTYLGLLVTINISFAAIAKLNKRMWGKNQLTVNTKLKVYQACILSTLL